jgi:nucleotide-binding universal stress UspA family protein
MSRAIVVGVDGSEASAAALRWAAEEARLRSAPLVAVYAWSFIPPQPIGDPGMLAVPAVDLVGQLGAESDVAREALTDAVSDVLGNEPSVEVEQKLLEGDPGDALVAESRSAELVVVGSHGRSGLKAVGRL